MRTRVQGSLPRDLVRRGYIAAVWCEGREILRRIFVTLRDRRWREVLATDFEYAINEAAGAAEFRARHVGEEVDFEWRGVLKVSENLRELRFSFEGKALRDMEVCRVGLVVLHPVESIVESQVSVLSPQGDQRLTVPRLISPQPIVNGVPQGMTEPFSGLIIERPDFGRLELRFGGDLFELEDQRNWGDASFKTYCTPLRLGFPRKVPVGTLIAHSVEARFVPAVEHARTSAATHAAPRRTVFPRLRSEPSLIQIGNPPDVLALQRALSSPSSTRVELQVELGTGSELPADLWATLSRFKERIQQLLIYGSGNSLPSARAVERLRRELTFFGALGLPLAAATRGYFVEFNRGAKFEAPTSGIAFPLTATVHADDPDTITENVTALVDIAETARHVTGATEIVISPLALYFPRAASPTKFPKTLVRPWLAATLMHAALAGVTSITLADDLLEAVGSRRDEFISGLFECAGLEVEPARSPLPAGMHALTFVSKGSEPARMLVANLGSGAASLTVDEFKIQIPRYVTMWIERSR